MFLLKSVALVAPFAALSVPTLVHTLGVVIQSERSPALREGVFDSEMEGKFQVLLKNDTAVIIGGDHELLLTAWRSIENDRAQ